MTLFLDPRASEFWRGFIIGAFLFWPGLMLAVLR